MSARRNPTRALRRRGGVADGRIYASNRSLVISKPIDPVAEMSSLRETKLGALARLEWRPTPCLFLADNVRKPVLPS